MSRIGKLPITLPKEVTFSVDSGLATVKGPRGELKQAIMPDVTISVVEDKIIVARANESASARALHGLTRTLLYNMIVGVSKGWTKDLEIVGTGYRAALQGTNLNLSLGFSHPVLVTPLPGVSFSVAGNKVTVSGADKQVVGEMAAMIRQKRKPEPYKGKGVRYLGEIVRRKAGKAKKAGAK
ncbi:MAG: 50S ribosomal protein L6 [bacterium]|nr:50S ribosomal protein L6 [bacterium]